LEVTVFESKDQKAMQRKIYEQLKAHLVKKEYTILTGARQTGKSTLLRHLEAACKGIAIPCVFLNMENKTILADLDSNPLNLLNYLPAENKRTIIFIDEVQYLKDPSNFLKLIYDEHAENIKIVATASSAFYLDNAFRDSLAGRKKVFQLLTCSFDEYLQLTGKEDLLSEMNRLITNKKAKSTQINCIKNEWETFMLLRRLPGRHYRTFLK
jgi:predicted AAA+ superfamily ATPase